ncbi:hypothetical protein [Halobaculum sp. MBLA0143]|uniref:hypothetical protein n=1 Tax=Halobaculum sp. MBLA0143 TaxID=3079933 RepID=UPI0035242BAA
MTDEGPGVSRWVEATTAFDRVQSTALSTAPTRLVWVVCSLVEDRLATWPDARDG